MVMAQTATAIQKTARAIPPGRKRGPSAEGNICEKGETVSVARSGWDESNATHVRCKEVRHIRQRVHQEKGSCSLRPRTSDGRRDPRPAEVEGDVGSEAHEEHGGVAVGNEEQSRQL